MQRLAWSDSFSVGHAGLDEEHGSIIAVINSIGTDEPNGDRLRQLLDCLLATTSRHFAHEHSVVQTILSNIDAEQLTIKSMSREAATRHQKEHELSLELLGRLAADASASRPPNPREVYEKLVHWFVQHAIKHDAELKAVFQALEKDCPTLLQALA